jgi:hypothetical protein
MSEETVARTPRDVPADVRVIPMHWLQILAVRGARAYVTCLSGLLSAGVTGADQGVLPNEFASLLWTCAGMAMAPAMMSILINGGELLARLDERLPKLRA